MRFVFFFAALTVFVLPSFSAHSIESEKFAIYYSDALAANQFKPYQLVVLDSVQHPSLQSLKEDSKIVLGYLSLGEVNQNNPAFFSLKSHNLILQENQNWQGSFFVDIRDPQWAKMVLEELIPEILRQGFNGLFLDTLDTSLALEESNRNKYAGMTEAAIHLVQAIRLHYPNIKIMMNRAYGILSKVVNSLDMELGESIYSGYDFAKKSYRKVEEVAYRDQVKVLQAAKQINPNLKIYSLDYADPADRSDITDIYRTERANGFIPYVATIGLDRLVDEPRNP